MKLTQLNSKESSDKIKREQAGKEKIGRENMANGRKELANSCWECRQTQR
jgi:hypothetical protein